MASQAQIDAEIDAKILTGGRRTTAQGTRDVMGTMNDSYQNLDAKDDPGGYVGLDEDGGASINGTLEFKNMVPTSATPSKTLGPGAGTGASATVTGTNFSGEISLTTGTGCADDDLVISLTLDGFSFPTKVHAVLFAGNDRAALSANGVLYAVEDTAGSVILIKSVPGTPLQDATTYVLHYIISGY